MSKVILAEKQFLEPLKAFETKQKKLVKDNPFVKITDNASFEVAKKSRTALVKGRTELQAQQKTINSKVNSIKDVVKEETTRLIAITGPAEDKQQEEVKAYESEQNKAREIREQIKKEKEAEIKGMIDEICTGFSSEIELLEFKDIKEFSIGFMNDVERIDTSAFEDLEMYFSGKIAVVKNELQSKSSDLRKEQELLESQAENRFQAFKSGWMERFMNASMNNIHQLNIDFDTEVPEIDADSFFTFKDEFIQQTGKFRDKLIDLTNVFKLEKGKADKAEEKRKEEERIEKAKSKIKTSINNWFNEGTLAVDKMVFDTIPSTADKLGKSFDYIKECGFYSDNKEIIDLKIEKLEGLNKSKSDELANWKIEFDKTEKKRIETEKKEAKKATADEKKRQLNLKPLKEAGIKNLMTINFKKTVDNKEIQEIINEYIDKSTELKEEYINKINNL